MELVNVSDGTQLWGEQYNRRATDLAAVQPALGDKDKAFAELEKAYQARDWDMHRLKVDPFMETLRPDPRFADLVKRIGLPQ